MENTNDWKLDIVRILILIAANVFCFISSFFILFILTVPGNMPGKEHISTTGLGIMFGLIIGSVIATYVAAKLRSERWFYFAVFLPLLPIILAVVYSFVSGFLSPFFN